MQASIFKDNSLFRPLFIYLHNLMPLPEQITKKLQMGVKLWTSDVRSDHAANWFNTPALFTQLVTLLATYFMTFFSRFFFVY